MKDILVSTDAATIVAGAERRAVTRLSDCATMHWGDVATTNSPTNALASGTAYGALALCAAAGAFTQMALFTSSATPANITDARVGVWDSTGALLLGSGNLSGTITAANTVYGALALGGTVNLTAGQLVYLGVAFYGASSPTLPTLRGWAGSGLIGLTSSIVRTKSASGWTGGALPNITGTNSANVFPWLTLLP